MMNEEYRATKQWPYHVSCGGAVFREKGGSREYLLLRRDGDTMHTTHGEPIHLNYGWHLPKGTLRHSETLEECALREIAEESGFAVAIVGYLGAIQDRWTSPAGQYTDKVTHYFASKAVSGDASMMDDEHDEVIWLSAAEAIENLKTMPKGESEIIERAEEWLEKFSG